MPTYSDNPIREAICVEAWSWCNTPYVDHGAVKHGGCDCAGLPLQVFKVGGFVPADYKLPPYSPQEWLNAPTQIDRKHLKVVSETMLNEILKFAREIPVEEVQPADLMLVKVVDSWTHGAIILKWPDLVVHSVVEKGVIASHALKAGFWAKRPKRFFSVVGR